MILLHVSANAQLHFHSSSLESLHEYFETDLLPEELGGKLPHGDELAKVMRSCDIFVSIGGLTLLYSQHVFWSFFLKALQCQDTVFYRC